MFIYVWKCSECGARVDVHRSLEDYRVPPTAEERMHVCDCDATSPSCTFTRVISPPKGVRVPENEDAYWNDRNYR